MADFEPDRMARYAPQELIGVSEWFQITQEMIDSFGRSTLDPDPMHIDPDWASRHSPYGGTIAYGFLTLSLLTRLLYSALGGSPAHDPEKSGHNLNYGFDRVRLIAPVRVGARVRGRFVMVGRAQDEHGRWRSGCRCEVEIEGADRPALIADWLSVWVPPATA